MPQSSSVIIPAYNASSTIEQAIASALDQTIPPTEVIVVCDGCTDITAQVSSSLGARVIEIARSNGSVARNAGVKQATGELLFFLDADDWWERDKIEVHQEIWSHHNAAFVIDRSRPILPDGSQAHWLGGIAEERDATWQEFLCYRSWASGSSFSVKRSTYNAITGFNEQLRKFQDVDFWVRVSHQFGVARSVGKILTNYRLSDSPTVSKGVTNIEENLQTLFQGWPFASLLEKENFRRHAYLTAAEVTPWPLSAEFFSKAHWPLTKPYFWKCLLKSLSTRRAA